MEEYRDLLQKIRLTGKRSIRGRRQEKRHIFLGLDQILFIVPSMEDRATESILSSPRNKNKDTEERSTQKTEERKCQQCSTKERN